MLAASLASALVVAAGAAASGGASITAAPVIGPTCYNGSDGPYTFVVTIRHKPAT